MGLFSRESPDERFWDWFQKSEPVLFAADPRDPIYQRDLTKALKAVHPDLCWETTPPTPGRRELVISAGGLRDAVPIADRLTAAAPPHPRWIFIALRPRRPGFADLVLSVNGRQLSSSDIEIALHPDDRRIGLELFVRGHGETGDYGEPVFLLLDAALGERDMTSRVGFVEVLPFGQQTEAKRIPFSDLRAAFDSAAVRH
jgi:hypothetical protein